VITTSPACVLLPVNWKDIGLEEPAEHITARLAVEGLVLPVDFVGDILIRFLDLAAEHPSLVLPDRRATIVKRISASLYEDETVVGRIVEEIVRELEFHPFVGGDDNEDDNMDEPTKGGFDPQEVAIRVADRLTTAGVPVTPRDVIAVMRPHAGLPDRRDPSKRPEIATRIAEATGHPAAVVARILDEVEPLVRDDPAGRWPELARTISASAPAQRALYRLLIGLVTALALALIALVLEVFAK
jgi:hypothetical protein